MDFGLFLSFLSGFGIFDLLFSSGLVFSLTSLHLFSDFSLVGSLGLDVLFVFSFDLFVSGTGLVHGFLSGFVSESLGFLFGGFSTDLFKAKSQEFFVEFFLVFVSFFLILFSRSTGFLSLGLRGFLETQFVELSIKILFLGIKLLFSLFIGLGGSLLSFFVLVVSFFESVSSARFSFDLFESEVIFFISITHQHVEFLVEVILVLVNSLSVDLGEFVQSSNNWSFRSFFFEIFKGKDFLIKFLLFFVMFSNSFFINMFMLHFLLVVSIFLEIKFHEFLVKLLLLNIVFSESGNGAI